MKDCHVSISMEPEKDNQGRERFRWNLTEYEKKSGCNYPMSTQKQGFAFSRIEALNEGIRAYDNLVNELSKLAERDLSLKTMFLDKNFDELRVLANDPIKLDQLSFDSLLCVILAKAFKRESYSDTEKLIKKLTLSHRAHKKVDPASMALITDERLASPTNVTDLHKLAQICSLLSMMLGLNESPLELVNLFEEAAKVWRQRAVKPPVYTGKMLVTRAYDLMELGEKDKAEENVLTALSKGIKGDSLITAANILKQVGQYNLAEKYYIKAIEVISDEDEELKGYIQESLNEVREKIVLNSPAAATRTDK